MSQSLSMKDIRARMKDGSLTGFRCTKCKKTWATPVARCASDGNAEFETVDLPTDGEVVTFTIQNVAPEEFMNETPYAWAIIKLSDGTQVTGWIPYVASDRDLAIGDQVVFTPTYKPGIMFEKC